MIVRDWLIAGVGGSLLLAATTALLVAGAGRTAPLPPRPATGAPPVMNWEGNAPPPEVAQEARLKNPAALFLPGAITAAASAEPFNGTAVAYSKLATGFPPEMAFLPQNLQLALPPPVSAPTSAAAALSVHPPGNLALAVGRHDPGALPAVAPRPAGYSVVALGTGKTVQSGQLGQGTEPLLEAPLVFYATISPGGLAGAPVLASAGPGPAPSPERLSEIEKQLAFRVDFGHSLPPGTYRITVGP